MRYFFSDLFFHIYLFIYWLIWSKVGTFFANINTVWNYLWEWRRFWAEDCTHIYVYKTNNNIDFNRFFLSFLWFDNGIGEIHGRPKKYETIFAYMQQMKNEKKNGLKIECVNELCCTGIARVHTYLLARIRLNRTIHQVNSIFAHVDWFGSVWVCFFSLFFVQYIIFVVRITYLIMREWCWFKVNSNPSVWIFCSSFGFSSCFSSIFPWKMWRNSI